MSQYSPTVGVQPLDLGGALSSGLDEFLRERQLKQQKDMEAFQTGFGAKLPQPQAATPNSPVSIMATAAPVPNTQTAPSAPLPGVGGLPSPGRVQGMNMPSGAQPTSDLGPALQTGQQRMINGVAQPHDDLRDAIANVGKQVNTDSQQPIMSLAGQSYTPPPSAPAFNPYDPNGMVTLPSGKQVQYGMTGFGQRMQQTQIANYLKTLAAGKDAADANKANADADLSRRKANVPMLGDPGYDQLVTQLAGDRAKAISTAQYPAYEDRVTAAMNARLKEIGAAGIQSRDLENLRAGVAQSLQTMRDKAASGRQLTQQDFITTVVEPFEAKLAGVKISGTQANTKLGLSGKILPQLEGAVGRGPLASPTSSTGDPTLDQYLNPETEDETP